MDPLRLGHLLSSRGEDCRFDHRYQGRPACFKFIRLRVRGSAFCSAFGEIARILGRTRVTSIPVLHVAPSRCAGICLWDGFSASSCFVACAVPANFIAICSPLLRRLHVLLVEAKSRSHGVKRTIGSPRKVAPNSPLIRTSSLTRKPTANATSSSSASAGSKSYDASQTVLKNSPSTSSECSTWR